MSDYEAIVGEQRPQEVLVVSGRRASESSNRGFIHAKAESWSRFPSLPEVTAIAVDSPLCWWHLPSKLVHTGESRTPINAYQPYHAEVAIAQPFHWKTGEFQARCSGSS
jgi:hypothetical protein